MILIGSDRTTGGLPRRAMASKRPCRHGQASRASCFALVLVGAVTASCVTASCVGAESADAPASLSIALAKDVRCDFVMYVDGIMVAQSPRGAIVIAPGEHWIRFESEGDRCVCGQVAIRLRPGEHRVLELVELR